LWWWCDDDNGDYDNNDDIDNDDDEKCDGCCYCSFWDAVSAVIVRNLS